MSEKLPFYKIFNLNATDQVVIYKASEGAIPLLRLSAYSHGYRSNTDLKIDQPEVINADGYLQALLQNFDEQKARSIHAKLSETVKKHLPLADLLSEMGGFCDPVDHTFARVWLTPAGTEILLLKDKEKNASPSSFILRLVQNHQGGSSAGYEQAEYFASVHARNRAFDHPENLSYVKKILLSEELPVSELLEPSTPKLRLT